MRYAWKYILCAFEIELLQFLSHDDNYYRRTGRRGGKGGGGATLEIFILSTCRENNILLTRSFLAAFISKILSPRRQNSR